MHNENYSPSNTAPPIIMSLSLHDPSGGSGIQADIETANSLGCHCTPVITTLCAQDTCEIKDISPVPSSLLIAQARAILEDMPVKIIKIGYPGSIENIEAIHSILRDYPDIPVVFDPTTRIAQDESESPEHLFDAMRTLLLPLTSIVICNLSEAYDLAHQADTLDACAQEILESGCEHLLLSGSRTSKDLFESFLYNSNGIVKSFSRERLKIISRGHGTTLSAAIACYLGHSLNTIEAIEQAQCFTWQSLSRHRRLGMGKHFLNRFFWTDESNKSIKSKH